MVAPDQQATVLILHVRLCGILPFGCVSSTPGMAGMHELILGIHCTIVQISTLVSNDGTIPDFILNNIVYGLDWNGLAGINHHLLFTAPPEHPIQLTMSSNPFGRSSSARLETYLHL